MLRKIRALLRNTRLRYMISYLLITVLLIGAISIYMYSYYSRSVLESAVSGETGIMYQVKYLCDGYIQLIESCADRLAMTDPADYGNTLKDMRITGDGDGILFVSDGTGDFPAGFEEVSQEELSGMLSAHTKCLLPAQNVIYNGVRRLYAAFICPIENSTYSLVCLLPAESLRLETEGEDTSLRSRYILWNDEILAQSTGFTMDSSNISHYGLSGSGETTETKRVNGREYLFLSLNSNAEGIRYVSVLTLTGIRANAAGVWLGFAAFVLLLTLPCMGFMLFISRQNLKPILEISRRFGSNDGDEIGSIDKGIKGLEGENAALNTIVNDSLPARRHMFVKQLVRGLGGSRAEIIREGSDLGIDTSLAYSCVILTGHNAFDPAGISVPGVSAAGTDMLERHEFLIIAFADEAALLEEYAGKVFDAGTVPVAVSNIHDELNELPGAYLEASAAYESRFIMGTSRLLRFSSIPISGKGHTDTVRYINRIRTAISEADTQALEICLSELTLYLKGGDMTLFAFRKFYNDIISAVAAEAGSAFTPEMYDLFSLSECSSLDELDSILRSVCTRIIAARVKSGDVSPVQTLARALSENYTNCEFSVASATEALGITSARISADFKSAFGMTPADYLTMLRMEQSKKLLAETDLPVRDIASGSGYADASSFTRRFRIYTGNTPLQYRQAAKNGELLDT